MLWCQAEASPVYDILSSACRQFTAVFLRPWHWQNVSCIIALGKNTWCHSEHCNGKGSRILWTTSCTRTMHLHYLLPIIIIVGAHVSSMRNLLHNRWRSEQRDQNTSWRHFSSVDVTPRKRSCTFYCRSYPPQNICPYCRFFIRKTDEIVFGAWWWVILGQELTVKRIRSQHLLYKGRKTSWNDRMFWSVTNPTFSTIGKSRNFNTPSRNDPVLHGI
jgi:hypothetical protein